MYKGLSLERIFNTILLITFLLLSRSVSFGLPNSTCSDALAGNGPTQLIKKPDNQGVNYTDVKTLSMLSSYFSGLSPENRERVFASLRQIDFNKALSEIQSDKPSESLQDILRMEAINTELLMSLISFGMVFPNVFQQDNASSMVPKILNTLKSHSTLTKGNRIFGENQVNANILNSSIWQSITSTIRSGLADYQVGSRIVERQPIGFWKSVWRKVRRFWQSHYSRIRKVIIPFAVDLQKMLTREIALDEIVIDKTFSENYSLSESTRVSILDRYLEDTGEAITGVEELAKAAFGSDFSRTTSVYIHEIDVLNAADRIKKINKSKISETQDRVLLESLDEVNNRVNIDLKQQGKPELSMEHFLEKELQLYFGILTRNIPRKLSKYFEATEMPTGDSYVITDKVKHESVTRDSKGNVVNRQVWYTYPTTTINVTFEMVLSGNYRTGNFSNGRLSDVKREAGAMVEVESVFRDISNKMDSMASSFEDKFLKFGKEGEPTREELKSLLEKQLSILDDNIEFLDKYLAKRPLLYSFDTEQSFQQRNVAMLKRLKNTQRLLSVQIEMLNRPQLMSLYITFNVWNDYYWLDLLKTPHKNNITLKVLLALKFLTISAVSGGAVMYHNDYSFMYYINENYPFFMELFKTLGGG